MALVCVCEVKPGARYADQDFAFAGFRLWKLSDLQDFRAAELSDLDRSHSHWCSLTVWGAGMPSRRRDRPTGSLRGDGTNSRWINCI